MKERIRIHLQRRTQFEQALLDTPVVVYGEKPCVSEPYITFMQLIARGYYNHEILLHPGNVTNFVKELQRACIDFPNNKDWDISQTERRVLRALQSSSNLDQVLQKTKLDTTMKGIKRHILRIKKAGRAREIPHLPEH